MMGLDPGLSLVSCPGCQGTPISEIPQRGYMHRLPRDQKGGRGHSYWYFRSQSIRKHPEGTALSHPQPPP